MSIKDISKLEPFFEFNNLEELILFQYNLSLRNKKLSPERLKVLNDAKKEI